MILAKNQPLSTILVPGVVIWRPVCITAYSAELMDVEWSEGDKKNWVARMPFTDPYINEPVLCDYKLRVASLTVFCNENIRPEGDWTHMIVRGVSKALQVANGRGGAVFAETAPPYRVYDYLAFRLRQHLTSDTIWPDEERPGTARLSWKSVNEAIHYELFEEE